MPLHGIGQGLALGVTSGCDEVLRPAGMVDLDELLLGDDRTGPSSSSLLNTSRDGIAGQSQFAFEADCGGVLELGRAAAEHPAQSRGSHRIGGSSLALTAHCGAQRCHDVRAESLWFEFAQPCEERQMRAGMCLIVDIRGQLGGILVEAEDDLLGICQISLSSRLLTLASTTVGAGSLFAGIF